MLIFDSFPTSDAAERFALAVRNMALEATVHDSQESSDKLDPFPWLLVAPIVLVERTEGHNAVVIERTLCKLVEDFDGDFAGT